MKTSKALMTALCTMMLCGCAKEEMNNNGTPVIMGDGSLLVYIDNSMAKTSMKLDGDGHGKIKWLSDDEMTINGTVCSIEEVLSEYDDVVAKLQGIELENEDDYEAFYPSTLSNWVLPSVQTYAPDINTEGDISGVYPMYGKGNVENDLIHFHNILGLLQIRICSSNTEKDYTIKEIKVSDPNKGMCGAFTVTLTETLDKWTAVLTDNTNKIPVTLDCGEGVTVGTDHVTDFYVGIPAGTYDALTVTVTDTEGNTREVVNNVQATVTRGNVYRLEFAYPFNFRKVDGLVDLGLSVEWASCNLGASSPEEYGEYYQWAGTENVASTSIYLDWDRCPYHTGSAETTGWTKYNTISEYGTVDNKTVLDLEDDAAHAKLGGSYRMPTDAEWTELRTNCTWEWKTDYYGTGKNGYLVTSNKSGYTDKSIFLPAAGYRYHNVSDQIGSLGHYWSSSLFVSTPAVGYCHDFNSSDKYQATSYRYTGFPVRPVHPVTSVVSYTITAKPAAGCETMGTVSGSNVYPKGATATLTATPNPGYKFVEWNDGVTTATRQVTVSADATYEAEFAALCNFVNLGLPSGNLWADANLGASSESEFGWLFSWGNVKPYFWNGSTWENGLDGTTTFGGFTPVNYSVTPGQSLTDNIPATAEYDAAVMLLGNGYRIPTKDDFQELMDYTSQSYDGTKKGWYFTNKTDDNQKIFLPIAGTGKDDGTYDKTAVGHYWSSTVGNSSYSYDLRIDSKGIKLSSDYTRNHGFSIRPVKIVSVE